MPELLKSYIVRPADALTPKQITNSAIPSHPEGLISRRFIRWQELCRAENYMEFENEMKAFLTSSEAYTSFNNVPEFYRKPLEFAHYNGYNFSIEELKAQLHIEKIQEDIRSSDKKERVRGESKFLNTYSNFSDQLIGEAAIKDFLPKHNLDLQAILKTLILIEILIHSRNESQLINVERFYEFPIIFPACFMEMDPCRGRKKVTQTETAPKDVKTETTSTTGTTNKEPDCGCGKKTEKSPCECTCDETCVEQNPCCAKIVPYIADLFVVKEEVRTYEVGEMSYIENVLKDEIRERTQRNLEREEINTEHEEETTSFDQREHSVDDKFSLQKEIDKAIETTLSVDAGVTAHQKWGTGDVTATTNVGYNQSKKDAQKTTQDNAKQIIDKSITSLQKKVRDFTSRKITKEIEEINKHTFGGLAGATQDMSRQFYYVNQIKRAQVFNYGKRQLLDFYLPEPSELYKRLIEKKFNKKKPEKPCITISEIKGDNYLKYVKCYGLKDIDFPPITNKEEILHFSGGSGEPKWHWLGDYYTGSGSNPGCPSQGIVVPDGYVTANMYCNVASGTSSNGHNIGYYVELKLGNQSVLTQSNASDREYAELSQYEGSQTVSVDYLNVTSFAVDLKITYTLKTETLLKWQLPIYYKIMEAYEKELAEYNEALIEFERTKEKAYRQNPFILLQDIQEQLKQAAISYISCQFFDEMNAMKHNVKPCGLPQFDIQETKKEGEFVRFFEQAFEWKFMNFIFYPYFWSRKCTWEKKMNEEADNMLFQRFLRAGYARVSVSIRPGFEGQVNYYLVARKFYPRGGMPPLMGSVQLPIFQEIKEDKDNFNTEREGKIQVINNSNEVILTNTDQYWDAINHVDNEYKIGLDINREMFIDCKPYKIISITRDTSTIIDPLHKTWTIKLDKIYDGVNASNLPWSTGAIYVGAPWEFKVPTKLVWLRENTGKITDLYPIK